MRFVSSFHAGLCLLLAAWAAPVLADVPAPTAGQTGGRAGGAGGTAGQTAGEGAGTPSAPEDEDAEREAGTRPAAQSVAAPGTAEEPSEAPSLSPDAIPPDAVDADSHGAPLRLDAGPPKPLPGFEPGPGAQPEPPPTPKWNPRWRKAGFWDAVVVGSGSALYVAEGLIDGGGDHADWDKPLLWDNSVREALRLRVSSSRDTAALVSDVMMVGSLVHNVVFDNLIIAWAVHGQPELAWQMSLMNAEAYALALSLTSIVKAATSRARPMVSECNDDPSYSPDCEALDKYRSFFSGHAAVTAVGAGLLCAHHLNLPLYDGGLVDVGTCVMGIGLTIATGALRIASDKHWATDVSMGHLVGFASGFLIPTLLYYNERGDDRPETSSAASSGPRAVVLPSFGENFLGLQAVGRM